MLAGFFCNEGWRLGPAFFWQFGRSDVDDAVVDALHEVDAAAMAGLFGGYIRKDPEEIRRQALLLEECGMQAMRMAAGPREAIFSGCSGLHCR